MSQESSSPSLDDLKERLGISVAEQVLFNAMPQLGWVAQPDGAIRYYNQRWYEYTGTTSDQMEGWGWKSVHDPELLPDVLSRWQESLASRKAFEMAFPLRRHDGVFRWFKTYVTPIFDNAGELLRWIGVNTDIDEEKRNESVLQDLNDLAFSLSGATTPKEVARLIVDRGMKFARADTCTLYILEEDDSSFHLLAHGGIAPERIEQLELIRLREGSGSFESVRNKQSLWVQTAQEYAEMFPAISQNQSNGPRVESFWSLPLVAEGSAIGLLGMGFHHESTFSAKERALVEAFGRQCGQALLRATRRESEFTRRRLLATTLQSIGDAVIATDTHQRITFMNTVAEKLTGWTESEGRGQLLDVIFPIFHEGTLERVTSPVDRVLREGVVVGLANHTVLRSRTGQEVPIDDSAAPIRDAQGDLFGVVLVFRDVSAEKREQRRRDFLARAGVALAESLDYRTTLSAVAQLAVPELADWCTVDLIEPGQLATQQVALAHKDPEKVARGRQLGQQYPPDPRAPTGVPQVIRSGLAELYPEIPQALLEAGAQDAEHLRLIRELRLESAMVVPLKGRDHTLGAMTFIYADSGRRYTADDLAFAEEFARRAALVIENARAFKQLEESRAEERTLRREADIANRTKDEFLATVSHELRTPLNAILGWATILLQRPHSEESGKGLAIIERNARRQARLIDDVLDVSRIISGKLSLKLGPTNVGQAIDNAIETVAAAAQAKNVSIEKESGGDFTITADGDRLQQVAWNVLTNAVKFTPKGGTIKVDTFREGSEVCIKVTDNGEGIAPDALERIFEPFHQTDASTTRRHGGLGLGLSIVKQLVLAHGGTIRAQSAGKGTGTTFIITIPARTAVPAVMEPVPAMTPSLAPGAPKDTLPRLDGMTVLVVDDEEDARHMIEQVLRGQGATVHLAGSAKEALGLLEVQRPDVLVSDIGMPEMDGYSLIQSIRSLPLSRGGHTPAVALTAYTRGEDAQRAYLAGFQKHITKPVEPSELLVAVSALR